VLVFTADNDTAYAIAREHLIMPLRSRQIITERFQGPDG
jgi:hypothetical protein